MKHLFKIKLLLFIFLATGCASTEDTKQSKPATNKPEAKSSPISKQDRHIMKFADDILLALATKNYEKIKNNIGPNHSSISGKQAADSILLTDANAAVLIEWNAKLITTTFSQDQLSAQAHGKLIYKKAPNQRTQSAKFILYFYRNHISEPWYLDLP